MATKTTTKPQNKTTASKPPSRGLGKGLSALIGESYPAPSSEPRVSNKPAARAVSGETVTQIAVMQIGPGKFQPRTRFDEGAITELAESIAKNGIVQPILLRAIAGGRYEIIAGERRWRAAKQAGLASVPAIVREFSDRQALEVALIENIQRQDLSPLEEAGGYQRLIEEFGYTQDELANAVGKSRSHVTNLMRLLALPEDVKEMLTKGEISTSHARALITAQNPSELAQDIIRKGLTVRAAEQFSKGARTRSKPPAAKPSAQTAAQTEMQPGTPSQPAQQAAIAKDPDILALEESLSENLGLRVSINDRGQRGEIVLAYDSLSQLDEILRRLGNGY